MGGAAGNLLHTPSLMLYRVRSCGWLERRAAVPLLFRGTLMMEGRVIIRPLSSVSLVLPQSINNSPFKQLVLNDMLLIVRGAAINTSETFKYKVFTFI